MFHVDEASRQRAEARDLDRPDGRETFRIVLELFSSGCMCVTTRCVLARRRVVWSGSMVCDVSSRRFVCRGPRRRNCSDPLTPLLLGTECQLHITLCSCSEAWSFLVQSIEKEQWITARPRYFPYRCRPLVSFSSNFKRCSNVAHLRGDL